MNITALHKAAALLGLVALAAGVTPRLDFAPALPAAGEVCAAPSEVPAQQWVPGGAFRMGGALTYAEEGPVHGVQVDGFWMDSHEVTNRQFARFVAATGYRTLAERGVDDPALPEELRAPGSAVFVPPEAEDNDPWRGWWRFVPGADWRHPEGPHSSLTGREDHPVVHVAYEDAAAYAAWLGRELPTEAQFEYAAQGDARRDAAGRHVSNTWQGLFPFDNQSEDGHAGLAPVGCYPANALGLHDLIGNVWEWTASPYYPTHDFPAADTWPAGFDPARPGEAVAVIKGGSYLCSANYCMRYRPEARQGQSKGLGASHIGFRTVAGPQSSPGG